MLKDMLNRVTGRKSPSESPEKLENPVELLQNKLDHLAELREQQARLLKPFTERMQQIQTTILDPLLSEQALAVGDLPEQIARLEKACKDLGATVGKNVFGTWLKAEYVSPKDLADVKGLLGYAIDHPGVKQFLGKSKPSCRIKQISAKERKQLDLEQAAAIA